MTNNTAIGIDLGGTNVRAGLVQEGTVIRSASARIAELGTEQEVLDVIADLIEDVWQEGVSSIGIGVPSIVDPRRGIVYDTVNIPSWKEVYLKDILEARFRIPVWVNNDANCFALGEKYYGAGAAVAARPATGAPGAAPHYGTLAGVTLGTGLGAGIVLDGKLFNGAHCGAGEIGNIIYKDASLEYYASGQYFIHTHQQAGESLLQLAEAGDAAAKAAFHHFGFHVGQAMLMIVYAYDPDIIVLGGSVSAAFRFFEKGMQAVLSTCVFPHSLKDLRITVSRTKDVALLGASLLNGERQLL